MAAFIPAFLGAAQGFADRKSAASRAGRLDNRHLMNFLRALFPESLPNSAFAQNFRSQVSNRAGLGQSNALNQLMSLIGANQTGQVGGPRTTGALGSLALTANAQRNQGELDLGQFQIGARTAGTNAFFNRGALLNQIGDTSRTGGALGGGIAGLGAGLEAGLPLFAFPGLGGNNSSVGDISQTTPVGGTATGSRFAGPSITGFG